MEKVKVKIIKENNDLEVGTVKALSAANAKRIIAAGFAEEFKEAKPKPAPKKRATKKEAE